MTATVAGLEGYTGYSYVGRATCGCAVAIALDFADDSTRQVLTEWLQDGRSIERHHHSANPVDLLNLICLHKPKFGRPSPYERCRTCYKRVKVGKHGQLLQHRGYGGRSRCSASGRVVR